MALDLVVALIAHVIIAFLGALFILIVAVSIYSIIRLVIDEIREGRLRD